ncbi:adenylate kinase Adk1 [Reticulomyxa filosa]|uniref:Adenylate kinase Adk1 n=1 Tax=Reticulomyxa filosa TaxID=46433 RepID=X6MCA6_RETFI|nr:adenylate kinase Adk1 [Reticulomyxa filosa]|eukprot:ETO11296.1 adenylate kinase Adk1 [Reticulomyxa filosa]
MLRNAAAAGKETGKKAKALMEAGKLVSDGIVNAIVRDELASSRCKRGFVLDGYPRTVAQAEYLDSVLHLQKRKITHVLELKARILGRWIHKSSGRCYHDQFNPPKVKGVDDVTGEPLIKRSDDTEESLTKRLEEYRKQTHPVVKHYQSSRCIHPIDANTTIENIWSKFLECFRLKGNKCIILIAFLAYVLQFLGPPGAGKGTHAPVLRDWLGIPHLSTGDMLRAAVAAGTNYGKKAKVLMDAGKLVDDELVNAIVAEALNEKKCRNGFILGNDGYPRTTGQAIALDTALQAHKKHITHVVEICVPDDELKTRILGRLVHKSSGRSYHVQFNPPKVPGKDDITGEPLEKRGDDNEETLGKRLVAYHEQTQPVTKHYKSKNVVISVNGSCPSSKVWQQIFDVFWE